MDWYRRYHGTCADPKFRLIARAARVPTPFVIAAWDAVLEHASAHDDRGSIEGLSAELLAVTIDCDEDEAGQMLNEFHRRGMITDRVTAWEKRQFKTDGSTERVRAWRAKQRTSTDETLQQRSRIVDETGRTEQSISEQSISEQSRSDPIPHMPPTPLAPSASADSTKPKRKRSNDYSPEFERFMDVFPTRQQDGKADCWKLWKAAINRGEDAESILRHAAEYRTVWLGNEFRIGARRYLRNEEWRRPVPVPNTSVVPFANAQPPAKSPINIHQRALARLGNLGFDDDDTGNGGGYLALAH